jgi:hypothetical protein
MISKFSEVPVELVGQCLEHAILTFGVWQALRLRTVCKMFDQEIIAGLGRARALETDNITMGPHGPRKLVPSPEITNRYIIARVFTDGRCRKQLSGRLHSVLENLGYSCERNEGEYYEAMVTLISAVTYSNGSLNAIKLLDEQYWIPWRDEGFRKDIDVLGAKAILGKDIHEQDWERPHKLYGNVRRPGGIFHEAMLVLEAIERDENLVNQIFDNPRCQYRYMWQAVQTSIGHGKIQVLRTLLNSEHRTEDSHFHPRFIRDAAKRGDSTIFRLLLERQPSSSDILVRAHSLYRRHYRPASGLTDHYILYKLAEGGHTSLVEEALIQIQTGKLKVPMFGKYTPLCAAASQGQSETVRCILNSSVYSVNRETITYAIIKAAWHGHLSTLKILLSFEGQFTWTRHHYFALKYAARNGHTEVVRFLLDLLPLEPYIELGKSALKEAVRYGYESIARLLIEHGVPVDAQNDDHSPMMTAILAGQPHVVKMLRQYGAKEVDIWTYHMKRIHLKCSYCGPTEVFMYKSRYAVQYQKCTRLGRIVLDTPGGYKPSRVDFLFGNAGREARFMKEGEDGTMEEVQMEEMWYEAFKCECEFWPQKGKGKTHPLCLPRCL